jgi:hypothetical protein
MRIDEFTVPTDSMSEAEFYASDVPWDAFRAFIQ